MAKAKTLRKRKFIKNTLERTVASWRGAGNVLALLARAEGSDIAVGSIGIDHLQKISGGQF